jgi:hypothetical protein
MQEFEGYLRDNLGYVDKLKGVFKKVKKNVSILLIVLFILAISTLILFAEEVKYDFRKTNWSMNKEQVKITEDKKPDYENNNTLGYEVIINGKDFRCFYNFLEDKLYSSEYTLSWKYVVKNVYIESYEELKVILIKKYGKPKIDTPGLWEDDLYKNDRSQWWKTLNSGDYIYLASWETPTTEISLILSGDDNKMNLLLSYDSKELREWAKEIKEKETLKDF